MNFDIFEGTEMYTEKELDGIIGEFTLESYGWRTYFFEPAKGRGYLMGWGCGVVSLDEEEKFKIFWLSRTELERYIAEEEEKLGDMIEARVDDDPSGDLPLRDILLQSAMLRELSRGNSHAVKMLAMYCLHNSSPETLGIQQVDVGVSEEDDEEATNGEENSKG